MLAEKKSGVGISVHIRIDRTRPIAPTWISKGVDAVIDIEINIVRSLKAK